MAFGRIDARPRRKNSHRATETKRCHGHLQWLRGRDCALAEKGGCSGPIVAAHVDFLGSKGMGTKTEDWNAIPLCDCHHREQHDKGWGTFQRIYSFNAAAAAEAYAKASPHRRKWEDQQ